jgi:D-lactate dehydrogenase
MGKILDPKPQRIGRPSGPKMPDAVPDDLVNGTPKEIADELIHILGKDNVLHRVSDLVRFASDASPYRYIPQVIVRPRSKQDISAIFSWCKVHGKHAVFRAAGTSLNGQSQTDGVLIEVLHQWQGCTVENDGATLRAKPGTILNRANDKLARYGRKLGPDPASLDAATIGGVIANNAGGMRCTVHTDAYQTLTDCTFVLPSGTTIDTAHPDAETMFAKAEPDLVRGLMELRTELLAQPELVSRIKHKYSIRNTHGYRMCALLDGDTPLQIFKRLLVGSEGTLAFIAEAVLKTLPVSAVKGVAFIIFSSIDAAITTVPDLTALGASAVELMLGPSLTVASQSFEGTPRYWSELDPNSAALLVEFGAANVEELKSKETQVIETTRNSGLVRPVEFTSLEEAIELAWHVREGLLGLVGKTRPPGASMIIEDVCFPLQNLAKGAHDLMELLKKHDFIPNVSGHAAHGNLHFLLIARLNEEKEKKRYAQFMEEMVELIVKKYDGSLKAEHGTGINMAPFVAYEWGDAITAMMWKIKKLADPHGILGPNVILTRDSGIHLRAIKSVPTIEGITNATLCIECGFCEPHCPSRNITTTPRQRIVLRREMARQSEGSEVLKALQKDYSYDAIQTCAVDGTCSIACPIGINTGSLMIEFRKKENSEESEATALRIAKKWKRVEKLARAGLRATEIVQRIVGTAPVRAAAELARLVISKDLIPTVPGPMPAPAKKLPQTSREGATAVYFPACINRMFGQDLSAPHDLSLPEALLAVSKRAGKPLWIPNDVVGLCCGTPFHSKGFVQAQKFMASAMVEALWRWSDEGRLPVIIDAASCTHGIVRDMVADLSTEEKKKFDKVRIMDAIQWCLDLLPHLKINDKLGRIVLHPSCSMMHLHLVQPLEEIARAMAREVEIPIGASCCGMAGDRGLLHPELVRSATLDESESIAQSPPADAYLSSNRTCELGMRHATGHAYESFVYTLEKLSS